MPPRSEQLQIRVTAREKAALRRLARSAGQDVSAYVLGRALPSAVARVEAIVSALKDEGSRRFALAELSDLLSVVEPGEFEVVAGACDVSRLDPVWQNYVAALVEQAARLKGMAPPGWTSSVVPLQEPYFATPLKTLRPYLLRVTPVAFKRRNIFTDGGLGARV